MLQLVEVPVALLLMLVLQHIQFGTRHLRVPAEEIFDNRTVFRLHILPNPTIARWLSHWMPQPVLSWLVRLLPEWFAAGALSDELVDKVRRTYNKLTEEGVVHGDPRLHNFLYAPGRDGVVAVDFEFADLVVPGSDVTTNEHEFGALEDEILRRRRRSASSAAAAPTGAWRWAPGGRTPPVCLLAGDSDVLGSMGSADVVLGKAVSGTENSLEVGRVFCNQAHHF